MTRRQPPGIGMTSDRTRDRMVERLRVQGIKDEAVLAVMSSIPRHIFVDEAFSTRAYEDSPLPIGFGQTISSPYIVARMSELMNRNSPIGKVLEVGTGSGYQTAVLARLCGEVYSVERIAQLVARARANLRQLRLNNVRLQHADGLLGLPEAGPFDGIVVTAAATHAPADLLRQLSPMGRMVIPLGANEQRLCLIENTEAGFVDNTLEEVRFVPLKNDLA